MMKTVLQRDIRVDHCLQMFQLHAANLPVGEVAECGVGRGHTTFELDQLVLKAKKRLLAFDTFEGLPYDDSIEGAQQCKRGEMNYGDEFFNQLSSLKNTSIVPVKGLIENTLIQFSELKFSFVWIDLDLHLPTLFAYKFFESRMVAGGLIGFHDYGFVRCPGVKMVVDSEVDDDKFEKIFYKDWCYFVRRKF